MRSKLLLIFVVLGAIIFLPTGVIMAQVCLPQGCEEPGFYEPDYACILAKTLNTPGSSGRVDCCENKCKDGTNIVDDPTQLSSEFTNFGVFNVNVKVSYEKLPTLINLGFSTILAGLAIYALIRGIYIYAIKLANTTKAEDIAAVTKEATAIVIGFILAVTFLFITQVVFSILGLPPLNDLDLTIDPNNTPTTGPGITIN